MKHTTNALARKIGELIEEDGMERDQAIAVANSMCEKSCDEVEYDSSPPLGGEEFECVWILKPITH